MFDKHIYAKQHDVIWDEYKSKYRDIYTNDDPEEHSALVIDGVVNPDKYGGILFFLKEAHDAGSGFFWDIREWLSEKIRHPIWNRAAEWTYGLLNTTSETVPRFESWSESDKLAALNSISLVNVKKIRGLRQSTDKDLSSYVLENGNLLRQEIVACKPRIIVCGGTFKYLKDIFGYTPQKSNDHWYYRVPLSEELTDVLVIDYYHPSVIYSALLTYYGITNIYQQFLKENESHAD